MSNGFDFNKGPFIKESAAFYSMGWVGDVSWSEQAMLNVTAKTVVTETNKLPRLPQI
jgi:hypothetical protein